MRSEFRLIARTVVFLALAVISLGAAPIYHRVYEGQARLIPQTATCYQTITFDESYTSFSGSDECGSLGSFIYDGPILDLPPGSVVLSAELRQWGSLNIEVFDGAYSVEPIYPEKPFQGTAWGNPNFLVRLEGEYVYIVAQNDFHPAFDVVDTDYLADYLGGFGCIVAVTYEGAPDCDTEIGMPLPLRVNQIQSFFDFGYGRIDIVGVNSTTTVTTNWRFANSAAALYRLDITYEAPVPEPATASLLVVGAAGLLLLGRGRRTRQP